MKLGFLSPDVEDIGKAARLGFNAIELHAGAFGCAGEEALDSEKISRAAMLTAEHGVEITALAYYDVAFNPPAPDQFLSAYQRVFDAAGQLGVSVIASMSGFDANLDWDGNLRLWAERFGPVAEEAEMRNIRIAFENWMDIGGNLPFKPRNMGGSPETWDVWFQLLPSPALGIEFDPSHLYWQGIDHLRALRECQDRVYHVHAKDTEMLPEHQYRNGINGRSFRFRLPGYGEINWAHFISALDEIGYTGGVAIEHEDPIYRQERFDEGLVRARDVLQPLLTPGT